MLDGVITISNPIDTLIVGSTTSTPIESSSVTSATPNKEDSSVPFNSFNIAIISLITTIVVVRKRNSKFN